MRERVRMSSEQEVLAVNQYETIAVVLGVVIFGIILVAALMTGRHEHA